MFRYFNKVQTMHRLFYVNPNFTRLMVEQQKPSFQAVCVNYFSTSNTVFQISAAEENLIKISCLLKLAHQSLALPELGTGVP